jgi:cytoskeletal protein CcmA (bactofilin family)
MEGWRTWIPRGSSWRKDEPPREEASPARDGAPERATRTARIGKSITIRGDVSADEDLILEGRVDGNVDVRNHHLTVGADTQHVQAELAAREVTVLGRVVGNVIATDRVEIASTGRVDGGVVAPRLRLHEGGVLNGFVRTSPPEAAASFGALRAETRAVSERAS